MARPRSSLSRLDWIQAGQALLIEGGAGAVKLANLSRRLGVTSGSFYHHFRSFRGYLDALADYYGGENVDRIIEALGPVGSPADRLRLIRTLAEEWDINRLDSAMRVWASGDDRARAAVARLDDRLIEIMRAAFAELGFSHQQARVRALLAFAAGVGQPFLFGRPASSEDAALALEIIMDARGAGAEPD